jgi:hypothetical protein
MEDQDWTGGCQCGAVRYVLSETPANACICHCRMCQKQFGNFFGAFADVAPESFRITRGDAGWFQSSDEARRGFCRDCGTPLFYKFLGTKRIAVAIGSLDRHSDVKPQFQYGVESREPWFSELAHLPELHSGESGNGVGDTPERMEKIRLSSRQHPDHDTAEWPPR